MKHKRNILFGFLCIICSNTFSQGEFIIKIDRQDGSFVKVSSALTDITYIYPDHSAFDEASRIFYFPSVLKNHSLYGVKVSNGSIISNPNINNLVYFQFDNVSKKMYGIEQDQINDQKHFVSINPLNGGYKRLGSPMPGSSVYSAAYSTFDNESHTYIFIAPNKILYSINANNGSIMSQPELVLTNSENVVHISFDNSSGILYGLLKENEKYILVKINQTTGGCSKIGQGVNFGSGNGNSTIDEANQQYIYYYYNNGYYIATLDLLNGNVLYNNPVSPLDYGSPGSPIESKDNVFSLKYDNKHGRLYSIHWDAKITGNSPQYTEEFVNIFPNPTYEYATLEFSNRDQKKLSFALYDSRGRLVQKIINITKDYLDIKRGFLASGIYFYQLYNDQEIITKGKLIFN